MKLFYLIVVAFIFSACVEIDEPTYQTEVLCGITIGESYTSATNKIPKSYALITHHDYRKVYSGINFGFDGTLTIKHDSSGIINGAYFQVFNTSSPKDDLLKIADQITHLYGSSYYDDDSMIKWRPSTNTNIILFARHFADCVIVHLDSEE